MSEIMSATESQALAEYEAVVERGLATFVEVGNAMAAIRDQGLYRANYETFNAYCRERWNLGRAHAYRLMDAAAAVSPIGDTDLPTPSNEAQARELARIPDDARTEVWRETLARTDGKPTAKAIRDTYDPPEEVARREAIMRETRAPKSKKAEPHPAIAPVMPLPVTYDAPTSGEAARDDSPNDGDMPAWRARCRAAGYDIEEYEDYPEEFEEFALTAEYADVEAPDIDSLCDNLPIAPRAALKAHTGFLESASALRSDLEGAEDALKDFESADSGQPVPEWLREHHMRLRDALAQELAALVARLGRWSA